MDKLKEDLNAAIEICKRDFAALEAEYNNVFRHGIVGRDLTLDMAMVGLKHAYLNFERESNNRPLILETETTMNEHISKLNVAIERCKHHYSAMVLTYLDVFLYGMVGINNLDFDALDLAMESLQDAHWHFKCVCYNARPYLMTAGQQVALNANAAQPTAAEPVVANVSEEHNTAAIPEGIAENNTAAREEMAEGNSNTSASEETAEDRQLESA